MLTIPAGMNSLRINKTHRLAFCWDIVRTDGTHHRFTSHDRELVLADGFTYSPVGGLNPTAYRKDAGLKEQNLEFEGVITDDEITVDDLRGGRYREAVVVQSLVDWKYPWAGSFQTISYYMAESSFDGELYEVEVTGLTRRLKQSIGHVFGRTCKYDLGDSDCKINIATYTSSGTVASISEERRTFTTTGLGTPDDGYFAHGELEWTSGLNDGIKCDVKQWTLSSLTVELILPAPFDVAATDTFTITAGCPKTKGKCISKFSNGDNFGGDPYAPGTDKMIQTPMH